MRQKIYLETTVWYQMVNYADSEFKESTRQLFRLIEEEQYDVCISTYVLGEIALNGRKYRSKLEKLLRTYKPIVIQHHPEVEVIAQAYIENAFKHVPVEDVLADAFHAAVATTAHISYIASYNYRYLLNVQKQAQLNAVNLLAGYNHFLSAMPPFMFLDLKHYLGEKGTVNEKVWGLKSTYGTELQKLLSGKSDKREKKLQSFTRKQVERLELDAVELNRVSDFL